MDLQRKTCVKTGVQKSGLSVHFGLQHSSVHCKIAVRMLTVHLSWGEKKPTRGKDVQSLFCKCFWQPSAAFQPPPISLSFKNSLRSNHPLFLLKADTHIATALSKCQNLTEIMLFFNYLWHFSQKKHQNRKGRSIKKLLLCFPEPSYSSAEDGLRPQSPLPVPRCCEAQRGRKTNKECRYK